MFDAAAFLYLYLETPLHAGTGSSLGIVDLPIQRERVTHYPMIQGSGIKGPLRSLARDKNLPDLDLIFGPDTDKASEFGGALSVGDARILLFPVRSLTDVFVYTTSPDVLARFRRDAAPGGASVEWAELKPLPDPIDPTKPTALLTPSGHQRHGESLVLEEFSFGTRQSDAVGAIAAELAGRLFPNATDAYWREKLQRSLVVLPEDDFRDFAIYSTEVATRIRLEPKTKTVENQALWTEEHLPAETVLYVPLFATAARKDGAGVDAAEVLRRVAGLISTSGAYLRLGGDETVGRGLVRATWQRLPQA